MDEAKAEAKAEANSHQAKAKIALMFLAKFYILTPVFRKKTKYGASKISAQNGL